jgi:imidazolonepropionase-like amidohydrolase
MLGKLLIGAAALAIAAPATAQTVAITGGRVVIGDGSEPIDGGTVIIRNGRVVAAGAGVAVPADAQVVDAAGKWVTPGLVSGFSRIGLAEVDAAGSSNDTSAARSPFSAALDVAPAVNPQASAISINRAAGITRAVVAPIAEGSIFAGQGAVIDLGSDTDPITRRRAFQFIDWGKPARMRRAVAAFPPMLAAQRVARGRPVAGADHRSWRPERRRAGASAQRTQSAGHRRRDGRADDRADARARQRRAAHPLRRAALVPVVQGRQALLVRVDRASDILQALALRNEFSRLRLVLVGATEGWRVADRIRAAGVPVIANALTDLPASFEQLAATQSNVGGCGPRACRWRSATSMTTRPARSA